MYVERLDIFGDKPRPKAGPSLLLLVQNSWSILTISRARFERFNLGCGLAPTCLVYDRLRVTGADTLVSFDRVDSGV